MGAVDTNILVYAHRLEPPEHQLALKVLSDLATGSEPWALPWPCFYDFLRVLTHPRAFHPPTPPLLAWDAVQTLLDSPSLILISEGERHRKILDTLLHTSSVTGNLIHDGHIAALPLEHGVNQIITADEDFRRFPGLKVTSPFLGSARS